ncbi:flagellar hook-basal body complex protein [bacterium]|nr:flagellar hook-basal body complex protein [bacterium]
MLTSLNSGVSGMLNHQRKLDVTGNNIANVNTIGYKSSRITFADSLYSTLKVGRGPRDNYGGVNSVQLGFGAKVSTVDRDYSQGAINTTGFQTDLALQGSGFFIVRDGSETYYTRAGNFTVDAEGNMVAANGALVQGRMSGVDANEETHIALEDISLPLEMKIEPQATEEVRFYSNLNANATLSTASLNEAGTSGVTSVNGTAADGVGGTHTIEISGTNATNSTNTGINTGGIVTDTLASLGVTDTDGFQVTLDQGTSREVTYNIAGLTADSTVGDLVEALNGQVNGATFELSGGAITVTRDYAGVGTDYNVTLTDGGTGNITATMFDAGGTFQVNNGTASTLVATDTFVDNLGNTVVSDLNLSADEDTGLITQITGLGDGGVTINAENGLQAATGADALVIDTADTDHFTSILVYDSLGNTHTLKMRFAKTAEDNTWAWEAQMTEPAEAAGGNTGLVSFNEDGSLANFTYDNDADHFEFIPGGGADRVHITFDPGEYGTYNGITQSTAPFSTAAVEQDGYGMGILENILIDQNGKIIGNFTNGVNETLAEIMIADFNNARGLQAVGNNMFRGTESSGAAVIGLAQDTHGAQIESGALELSNVDLVKEFTEMITAQRGFQSNARVVTVSDQILAEATNLKR